MKSGIKNNLFITDRQNRNTYDFEGSGIGNGRYDKKMEFNEKIKNAALPIVLLIVFSAFAIFFIKDACTYVYVVNNYTKAELGEDIYGHPEFRTPDGEKYSISKDYDVYYQGENYAEYVKIPKMYIWEVVIGVVVFTLIYFFLIRSLYKNFHRTHHSEEKYIEPYEL